jgi:bile acid:Na+ symporter, BASS family
MSLDQAISPLVAIALIELMVATGLGIRLAEVVDAARDWRLLARAGLVNYVAVPCAAVLLLLLLRIEPTAAAGFLILAVCPGAPYAPPLTALAGGNVAISAGLMMVLAGSSVIVAPLLLSVLLPFTTGTGELRVDALRMLGTILVTQLLPLGSGLAVNYWRPDLAARLLKPAVAVGKILNVAVIGLILLTQARQLMEIRFIGILAMLIWLGISMVLGWSAGGLKDKDRRAVALTTSIRNVGLGVVITTSAFAGTPAVTAVLAYGLVQLLGSFLLALWWHHAPSLIGSAARRSTDAP